MAHIPLPDKAGDRKSDPGGMLTESSESYIFNQMVNH